MNNQNLWRKTTISFSRLIIWGLVVALMLSSSSARAQQAECDSLDSALITSMPFDLYFNLIFLKVEINGAGPFWMILDSGFEGTVINQSTLEKNGWPVTVSHKEAAPGGEIEVAYADSLDIVLPGLALDDMRAMVISLDGLEPIAGRVIDGILGHDFFSRFTLVIDYAAGRLDVYDSTNYRFGGGGQIIPITIENNEPFLFATLESGDRSPVRAKLKIDTGSSDFLGLNGSFVTHEDLFEPQKKKIPAQGAAVGGYTENYVTRLKGFRIGDMLIQNSVIGYSIDTLRGGDAGTIAGEFLSRFTVTFDYARHRIILKKNDHFSDPYEYDMSGIFPVAEPPDFKTIKIDNVTENSPAFEAGLKAGDIIISIDDKPAGEYSIAQIREMLKIDGKSYRLEIERARENMSIVLRLRSLI